LFDSDDLRVRIASVRLGAAATLAIALVSVAYYLTSWDEPNRPGMLALACAFGVFATGLLARPVAALIVGPRRIACFIAWSVLSAGGIAVFFYLDGGGRSPVAFGFVLALAFAGLLYPLRGAIAVAALVEVSYALPALLRPHRLMDVAFVMVALFCTAVMCVWTAWWRERQREELTRLSFTDPLTGCLNRRGFEEAVEGAVRDGRQFALVTLDLDDLKAINDSHGHAAGDAVLRTAVRTLQEAVRPTDSVGRLGGDEFAILLPDAPTEVAAQVLDRAVLALSIAAPASFGLASFPLDGTTGDELFSYADAAVYGAKPKRAVA
jgi:diguanylate cyclase (GGDEF)-like protein